MNSNFKNWIAGRKFTWSVFAILLTATVWRISQSPAAIYAWGRLKVNYQQRNFKGMVSGLSLVRLPVPYHRQEHALSCEVASLKMALAAHGVEVSESDLINFLPFDKAPRTKTTWGDPNLAFVGDIDGKMGVTGYGVYWEPIAKIGSIWKKTEVITDGTPQVLVEHLLQGRPIIIWGYYGRGKKLSWNTPEGKRVNAINGEHVMVVSGFVGSATEPEGFFIQDPIYGELYWSTEKLLENWGSFGNHGVVVYNEAPTLASLAK